MRICTYIRTLGAHLGRVLSSTPMCYLNLRVYNVTLYYWFMM